MPLLAIFLLLAVPALGAPPRKSRNIALVTVDGLRWQELLTGIDPLLMNAKEAGMEKAGPLRERFWRDNPSERREALMPFFWKRLARSGVVLTSVRVSNGIRVSYPGYSEILTGRAQDNVIKGNDEIQNPSETVLEFLRRKLNLPAARVALFGSWSTFRFIGESKPGSITINAGYTSAQGSPRLAELSRLQAEARTPWDTVRHDYVTFEMALDYLKRNQPRVLHLALGETDDWAHNKRYDRVLTSIEYTDRCFETLWNTLQKMPAYRNTTTLVIVPDHGRGSKLDDWDRHGAKVEGADRIWIAMLGPDTPAAGEVSTGDYFQRDVAPTILEALGIDHREYSGVLGRPIAAALKN
ncbi:MAG: sulfatase-like hydrolase/transferase [Bryobacteraceae bacterium]